MDGIYRKFCASGAIFIEQRISVWCTLPVSVLCRSAIYIRHFQRAGKLILINLIQILMCRTLP